MHLQLYIIWNKQNILLGSPDKRHNYFQFSNERRSDDIFDRLCNIGLRDLGDNCLLKYVYTRFHVYNEHETCTITSTMFKDWLISYQLTSYCANSALSIHLCTNFHDLSTTNVNVSVLVCSFSYIFMQCISYMLCLYE